MKLKRNTLRNLIKEELLILLEQEEDVAAVEEETAEEEEAGAEGEATEDVEEETAAEEEVGDEEELDPLAKSLDDEINAFFVDFETSALESAKDTFEVTDDLDIDVSESKLSLKVLLVEQDEEPPHLDMESFAADVARLSKNYDSLMNIPELIVVKALDYIRVRYDEATADELLDILELRYDISLEKKEEQLAPIAVGAMTPSA
jgi:hypothetical protein